jgi:hypothetical protein
MNIARYDKLLPALLLGFLFPLLCFSLYAKFRFPEVPLTEIYGHVQKLGITSAMLSLSVFLNLFIFFFFIWRKADKAAKGVLLATMLYAVVVVYIKFIA